jgi:hypothetical protein
MRRACVAAARTRWTLERHLDLTQAVYAEVNPKLTFKSDAAMDAGTSLGATREAGAGVLA